MRSMVGVALLLLALAGCEGAGDADADASGGSAAADTLSRAQKDTIVAESGLPGSRGVGRALDAARDANARSAAHDSLLE